MRMKKMLSLLLCAVLAAAMTACGSSGTAVYVQSVEKLAALGGIAPGDRFAGLVVSENVTEIQRDSQKTISELLVKAGDDVKEGQKLFSYDTEELQLTLDKQKLELEQLHSTIESLTEQIATLEKERSSVGAKTKLQYTLEIQTMQVDLKEAELNVKTKENEIAKSEDLLANAEVLSPVNGRIQSVSESGTDNYGNALPYITIQQAGSYRVKGTINEQQRGGIMEGDRIKLYSRTNDARVWSGTVTLVDYENPTQGNQTNTYYYGMDTDEMTASSNYPFYVELDTTEGLILGQHLYMELETEEGETSGPQLGSAFICYSEDGSAYVWAEKRGKLEKREVTLGEYNPMRDTFEILDGLTLEDYIAYPDSELCTEGASTTHDQAAEEAAAAEGEVA